MTFHGRSHALRYPSLHRRAALGQHTYVAGRARWRNHSHRLGRELRALELAEAGLVRGR